MLRKVLRRTRGWGWPACLVNFYYLLVLVMGVNHSALFTEGLEAGMQSSTQPLLPLSLPRAPEILSASSSQTCTCPLFFQIPDFKHRITVQASPGLDRRRNVFEVGAGDSPTFPRFRAIQCKKLVLPCLPYLPSLSSLITPCSSASRLPSSCLDFYLSSLHTPPLILLFSRQVII